MNQLRLRSLRHNVGDISVRFDNKTSFATVMEVCEAPPLLATRALTRKVGGGGNSGNHETDRDGILMKQNRNKP